VCRRAAEASAGSAALQAITVAAAKQLTRIALVTALATLAADGTSAPSSPALKDVTELPEEGDGKSVCADDEHLR